MIDKIKKLKNDTRKQAISSGINLEKKYMKLAISYGKIF